MDTAFVSLATAEYDQHPKESAISGAQGYLQKRRKELMAYLKIPMIPIDNNACERGLKPLVKGRKKSLFFQNLMGAWGASMMYGFFETWYAYTFPHCNMKSTEYLWPETKRLVKDERRSKSKLLVCA